MAFSHGSTAVLKINDGGSLRDMSAYITDTGLDRTRDMAETSALGSTAKSFIPGLKSGTIPLSGLFDPTADGYLQTMYDNATTAAFEYYPAGTPAGATKPKFTGNGFLSAYSIKDGVGGVNTFTATWQVDGAVTRALA